MSNYWDPDHDRPSNGLDLGTHCLEMLPADVKSYTNQEISLIFLYKLINV